MNLDVEDVYAKTQNQWKTLQKTTNYWKPKEH